METDRVKRLPPDVVERIAAGEVVERPASVVKELVENAIDAGARSVRIDVAGGGSERITVMDDGSGMGRSDLAMSVMRHATSKIGSADDLFSISTMGFRGEALAAIAAVSRLTIESRPNSPGVIEGHRIDVEGGIASMPAVAGCAPGTRVCVSDLFYNVPARRKFLRSTSVEAGHIYDVVAMYALAFPAMRFDLTVDGAKKLALPACVPDIGGLGSTGRIEAVLGLRMRGSIRVEEAGPHMSVRGLVSDGGRKGGRDSYIFLNGRPVKDRMLMHAIAQGMGERPGGCNPACVLWIEVDPSKVDVNVHPAKREVRFSEGGAVHSFLASAVKKPVSGATVRVEFGSPPPLRAIEGAPKAFASYEAAADRQAASAWPGDRGDEGGFVPIGQYALSYVLCEDADGSLVLIDQHAAHERMGFDELLKAYGEGALPVQRLLIPEQVELGERDAALIEENISVLEGAGFELEPFGGATVLVKAVPALVGDASVAPLLTKLAREFEDIGEGSSLDESMERVFATVACHRQVRAGDRLVASEIAQLVRDVESKGVTSCPHGRPALVRISKGEIEKWFRRK